MSSSASAPQVSPASIALTVTNSASGPVLSPFFEKCDGILITDPASGSSNFLPNESRSADCLCELILGSGARRLVCGYINAAKAEKLRAAGIDVRLGSCACQASELVACFCDLPEA